MKIYKNMMSIRQLIMILLFSSVISVFGQIVSDNHVVTLSVPDYADMIIIPRDGESDQQDLSDSDYYLSHNQKTDRKIVGHVLRIINNSELGITLIASLESPSGSNARSNGPTRLLDGNGIKDWATDIVIEINRGRFHDQPARISYDITTNDPETVFDGTIIVCYTLLPG